MAFRLIPKKEEAFFDLFDNDVANLKQAIDLLVRTLADLSNIHEAARRMKELEHEGDRITHEIMALLHRTFITPLDREDIHTLASRFDDVVDYVESATKRLEIFRIHRSDRLLMAIADVLVKQVEEIRQIMPKLREPHKDGILEHCVEINRLENEADRFLEEALGQLFADGQDALEALKWRELYEQLEMATDMAEDVAVVVEGIILKNA